MTLRVEESCGRDRLDRSPQKPCTYILTYDAVYRKAETLSSGGKPALFKSKDMHQWEYLGPVISGANTMRYPFEEIACPEFFSLGEKSMLLFISHSLGAQYYLGLSLTINSLPNNMGG